MKLLIDEMWTQVVAEQLRQRGFDVVSVLEHIRSATDSALLEPVREEQRAIVTENVDDFRFLVDAVWRSGGSHAGLIYTSPHSFFRGDPLSAGRLVVALEDLLS